MLSMSSQTQVAKPIGRFASPGGDEVVFLPIPRGTFHGEDDIPAGTFHGEDDIPAGTFHGEDDIPAGTFHGEDDIPAGTFHHGDADMPPLDDEDGVHEEPVERQGCLPAPDEDWAPVPEIPSL